MVEKTALGKYRLLYALGIGSNAEVFLASPFEYPNYRVVVKRIHGHVAAHPNFRMHFQAEVQSMANFNHPYVVRLLEAAVDDPIGPCLVMEYLPGLTLEAFLSRRGNLDPARIGRLLGCCCHAIQAAHDAGIVHRDLKPANLMVLNADTPQEALKVMDFGFAGFAAKPHIQLAELTGHGPIFSIGTPSYVSPEMIRGDRVDSRSDLYSVGIILYELLTGRLPFDYANQDKLLAAHVKESPPRFSCIGRGFLSAALEEVVQVALSKYPNERQQSARELALQFGQALGENYWESMRPEGWEPTPLAEVNQPQTPPKPADPYHVTHAFDTFMPECLAAAKLRGFVEDFGGLVLASEPGVIRMRLGVSNRRLESKDRSGLFGWFVGRRQAVPRGHEPVELELQMDKPAPGQPRLCVIAAFRPLKGYRPNDHRCWHDRCDKLHMALRQYLGA